VGSEAAGARVVLAALETAIGTLVVMDSCVKLKVDELGEREIALITGVGPLSVVKS